MSPGLAVVEEEPLPNQQEVVLDEPLAVSQEDALLADDVAGSVLHHLLPGHGLQAEKLPIRQGPPVQGMPSLAPVGREQIGPAVLKRHGPEAAPGQPQVKVTKAIQVRRPLAPSKLLAADTRRFLDEGTPQRIRIRPLLVAPLKLAVHPHLTDGRRHKPLAKQMRNVLVRPTPSCRSTKRTEITVPTRLPLRPRPLVRLTVKDGSNGLHVVTPAASTTTLSDFSLSIVPTAVRKRLKEERPVHAVALLPARPILQAPSRPAFGGQVDRLRRRPRLPETPERNKVEELRTAVGDEVARPSRPKPA